MKNLKKKYGGWALVTGASSGIGKEFVRELASQGFNMALVARSEEALKQLSQEITSKHAVETRIILADFTKEDAVQAVYDAVDDLDIGLLIPAAGVDEMGLFLDKNYSSLQAMMQLNVDAPTQLAHMFGKRMEKREHSGIILVASLFAYQGIPHFATYAATKAYILTLGEALTLEMKKKGIDVLTLSPGLTATPFAAGLKVNPKLLPMVAQNPRSVARIGLRNIGNKMSVVSGFLNKFYAWENRLIPRSWPVKLFGFLIGNAARSYEKHKKSAPQSPKAPV